MSAKVISVRTKVKPNAGSGSPKFGDLTITKPNGEVIVIKQEPRKVANRNKRNKKRASRKVRDKVRKVSEQDTKWIELQERREKLMREMGSIHAE